MKLLYKPFGLLFGVLGGVLASMVFRRVWMAVADEQDAPEATDRSRNWGEVVLAAAVQGALFGAVKALVDRAGATGFAKATGHWPGDEGQSGDATANA